MSGAAFDTARPSWVSAPYWDAVPALWGWVHSGGQPIYVEYYAGAGDPEEGRLPVLLLEGLGYGSWMWFRLLPDLVRERAVVVVDNRGVGGSSAACGPESIEQMADDAAAALSALGITRSHVVGVSMGGFIAQALALRHPHLVASLALVVTSAGGKEQEPPPPSTIRAMTQVEGLTPEQALRQAMQVAITPGWWETNQAMVDRIVRWRLDRPVRREAWLLQWQAIGAFDYTGRVHAISAPTLVLAAAADKVMPPANTRKLARLIPGARLVEVPEAGHWVFIEQPDVVAGELRELFADTER